MQQASDPLEWLLTLGCRGGGGILRLGPPPHDPVCMMGRGSKGNVPMPRGVSACFDFDLVNVELASLSCVLSGLRGMVGDFRECVSVVSCQLCISTPGWDVAAT